MIWLHVLALGKHSDTRPCMLWLGIKSLHKLLVICSVQLCLNTGGFCTRWITGELHYIYKLQQLSKTLNVIESLLPTFFCSTYN